ncbi:Pumilio domain-containing protein C6G9.14 [Diplonema papillatum]|nr:Pumilio domain-containing protein C6G9.14 [Diplonema papillatum]
MSAVHHQMPAPELDAPVMPPMPNLPHSITVVGPDCQVHMMPCNLATLTIRQLYMFCAAQFGALPDSFELLHSTDALPNDDKVKAIDIGLSNGMYVIMQQKGGYPNSTLDLMMAHTYGGPPSLGQSPHHMPSMSPTPMMPPMGHAHNMMPSPQLSPLESSLEMQYDLALAQNAHSQMQIVAALQNMSLSPVSTPSPVIPHHQLPVPVSPPMFAQHAMKEMSMPRVARPTGSINLNTIKGDFVSYAITNEGSRALAAAIEDSGDSSKIASELNELAANFGTVASHQHGSKVVRALLKVANSEQVTMMIRMACDAIIELCDSNTGSDVFVDVIAASSNNRDAEMVVTAIVSWGHRICTIINGRKILQALLTKFNDIYVEPVFDMIGQNLLHLATDQTGCVTIQRCLDHATNPTYKMVLQMQIMEATSFLIHDMYGNYVLQHAIKGDPANNCTKVLANKFKGSVAALSTNKYASCVIEKCLSLGSDDVREQIVTEVIPDIKKLMWDGFGNFVVQSAVDYAPGSMVDVLKEVITPFINDCPYGYRIEGKLNKRVKKGGRRSLPKPVKDRALSPQEKQALLNMMLSTASTSPVPVSPVPLPMPLGRANEVVIPPMPNVGVQAP